VSPPNLGRLRAFVTNLAVLVDQARDDETRILAQGSNLLRELVAVDDWLPLPYAAPDPTHYRQYLLHCDSLQRFSVVSFVWGPGQSTPIHNHTVWGLVGVLRGAELSQRHVRESGVVRPDGPLYRLEAGQVETVSPRTGDIHRVANALTDRPSISIHVYGANIGAVRRSSFDESGRSRAFISGYSNTTLPNLWDASQEAYA